MIDTVLFDLDGSLLPMDQEQFVQTYMSLLAEKMAPYGYEPKHLLATVWAGLRAMVETTAAIPTRMYSGRISVRASGRMPGRMSRCSRSSMRRISPIPAPSAALRRRRPGSWRN